MKTGSFLHELINELIQKGVIKNAITIPYMVGAYKIKQKDTSPATREYISSVLEHVLNDNKYDFFVYTCDNIVNDLVISNIDRDCDCYSDIYDSTYSYLSNPNDKVRIFFEGAFPIRTPSIEMISEYFWMLYSERLEQCLYSYNYDDDKWTPISDNEKGIIEDVAKHY